MDNEKIHSEFNKLKAKVRRYSIVIILGSAILLFGVASFFFTRGNNSRDIKQLKAENKALKKQMDSLNVSYSADSITRVNIIRQQEIDRHERENVLYQIRILSSQLSKFKNQYEKISNYKDISADSLLRLFNERFDN